MTIKVVATCDLCGRQVSCVDPDEFSPATFPSGWQRVSFEALSGQICEDCSTAVLEAVDEAVEAVVRKRRGSASPPLEETW